MSLELINMPSEILTKIFYFLDIMDFHELKTLCKLFYNIILEIENHPSYLELHLLRPALTNFITTIQNDFPDHPMVPYKLADILAITHNDACCELTFEQHVIQHWTEKNRLAFLYAYGVQNTSWAAKTILLWCAKNEYRILRNENKWRTELVNYLLNVPIPSANGNFDTFTKAIHISYIYGYDLISVMANMKSMNLYLYGGHESRNVSSIISLLLTHSDIIYSLLDQIHLGVNLITSQIANSS